MAYKNSKPVLTSKRLAIKDFEEQALSSLGQAPGYTLILDDESELHIPHPLLVADDRLNEIDAVQSNNDLDHQDIVDPDTGETISVPVVPATIDGKPADAHSVRLARAVLGAAEHKRFLAHGGKSAHIALAWQSLQAEAESASPKRGR